MGGPPTRQHSPHRESSLTAVRDAVQRLAVKRNQQKLRLPCCSSSSISIGATRSYWVPKSDAAVITCTHTRDVFEPNKDPFIGREENE